jgi:hypothetical protein
MTNSEHENNNLLVLNVADQPVVTDAVFPKMVFSLLSNKKMESE